VTAVGSAPPLKAITVLQPFATAIVSTDPGAKRSENRGWHRAYPPGGLWAAIHAGARTFPAPPQHGGWVGLLDRLTEQTGWDAWRVPGRPLGWPTYPRGAILGVARFVDCVPAASRPGDPWAYGPWCHVIAEVRPLPAPILGVKGALGFWTVPDEYLPPLRALLEAA
jgi:hypothetical protein